jgi:hypothetical protein
MLKGAAGLFGGLFLPELEPVRVYSFGAIPHTPVTRESFDAILKRFYPVTRIRDCVMPRCVHGYFTLPTV